MKVTETSELLIQERIKELRENTDFVSTLLESLVGYAIIAADFDGNIIAYNEGARQIYGYAPEEVIGKQGIDIFFHKDFIKAGRLQQIVNELIEKGRFACEGEKVRKNGEVFPAGILFTLTRDKNGKMVGFIEITADLTGRKQAEEARQQLQLQKLQLEQLEKERAEAIRNFQHYLAMSQGGLVEPRTLAHPDDGTLNELLPDYRDIILRYIHAVRIREDRPSESVRSFARQLSAVGARARDVVRIHLNVLNEFSQRAMPSEERAFSNDARLVLVELMGNLLDIYLNHLKSDGLTKGARK
jgi:PAS domain S-box-containing protein